MKPGHILTGTPRAFMAFLAEAQAADGWTLTAGPEIPEGAKYLFRLTGMPPEPLQALARRLQVADVPKIAADWGSVEHIGHAVTTPIGAVAGIADIAVCVTCHPPYARLLPQMIRCVNAQTVQPRERFLCLDGMTRADIPGATDEELVGWRIQELGEVCSPIPGRNAAIAGASTPWITFWDADDTVPRDHLARVGQELAAIDGHVAVLYHSQEKHWPDGRTELEDVPEWDYWSLRRRNYVTSHSMWRREALLECGGMPATSRFDDWAAALAVTYRGWTMQKSAVVMPWNMRRDGTQRHKLDPGTGNPDLWNHWHFAVVTLLAGRDEAFTSWRTWIETADLPCHCSLYVLDNSRGSAFGSRLRSALRSVARRFDSVTMLTDASSLPANPRTWDIYRHVARLYNAILPHVRADYILTLEDDVIPPLDGLRRLVDDLNIRRRVGAIGGLYQHRANRDMAIAATGTDYWHGSVSMVSAAGSVLDVGFLGGGFTLWNGGAMHQSLPFRITHNRPADNPKPHGWDGNLSLDIREQGMALRLDGNVTCNHMCL